MVQGWRLNNALTIDEEGIASTAQFKITQQGIETRRVDCCPQYVKGAVRQSILNGNDKMRHIAKAEKHLTDIKTFFGDFLEPFLVAVILAAKIVGSDIINLQTLFVNKTEVDEAVEALAEILEQGVEFLRLRQLAAMIVPDDKGESRKPFTEKKGYGPFGIGTYAQGAQEVLRFDGFLGKIIINAGDKDQWQEGYQGGQENGGFPDPPEVEHLPVRTCGQFAFLPELRFKLL